MAQALRNESALSSDLRVSNVKVRVQQVGRFLSGMVMPNIGAFVAWGLITSFFIPTGWMPNEHLAKLVGPMITYLLPILIGYTGGRLVGGDRGAVVGAIATAGLVVGASIPMFLGAMLVGPLGGWAIKKFDAAVEGKIRSGFEMLANNFSAGNIGRGFIGKILADAGWTVTFADIDPALVERLKRQKGYPVDVVGDSAREEMVSGVDAVLSTGDEVAARIGTADLITTAVGPSVLPRIAPVLTAGIRHRLAAGNRSPLNVIACENTIRGTTQLKEAVLPLVEPDLRAEAERLVGFADSAVDRIVPPNPAAQGWVASGLHPQLYLQRQLPDRLRRRLCHQRLHGLGRRPGPGDR